jgi:hypothetical protein
MSSIGLAKLALTMSGAIIRYVQAAKQSVRLGDEIEKRLYVVVCFIPNQRIHPHPQSRHQNRSLLFNKTLATNHLTTYGSSLPAVSVTISPSTLMSLSSTSTPPCWPANCTLDITTKSGILRRDLITIA